MRLPALTILVSLTVLATAQAATVPYRTDRELVTLATRVVRARVIDAEVVEDASGAIRTRTRIAVLEDFTGAADPLLTIVEPGGRLPDGRELWIPGAPRYMPGEEVVLCLERGPAGFRTVAFAFSAFHVRADAAGATLERFGGVAVAGGSRAAVEAPRTLAAFRETVAAAKGVRARVVLSAAEAQAHVAAAAGTRVDAPFTLLGGGIRWREADGDTTIFWYRNVLAPATVQGGDADAELRVALDAWTRPPDARITLAFGGERLDAGLAAGFLCSDVNLGVGLITWGDPADGLPTGVLAIGGGCATSATHVVNNTSFRSFTHGFVVMNDAAALAGYTTIPNITRILEHEIGHTIGLDHTDGDTSNIMYPSCCHPVTPIPPALGPDDRAGVVFIYPMPTPPCDFTFAPSRSTFDAPGGEATVTVTPNQLACSWAAVSTVPWLYVVAGADRGSGVGTVQFQVFPHMLQPQSRTGALRIGGKDLAIVQAALDPSDPDGDGLATGWEQFFGLNPNSPAGDDGAGGDPDGDGVSNLAEQAGHTHPRGTVRRYLAEGDAGPFFDTQVAIFNPLASPVTAWLRVQPEGAAETAWPVIVPPLTRRTITNDVFQAIAPSSFSTLVEANGPLVVDRTMRWDGTGFGSHAETSIEAPSTTWYLAEGSTSGDFSLFYLLQNPGDAAATATVRFLRPRPAPPIERTYTVRPRSRLTIPIDGLGPELASTDVSGVVTSDLPIVVERAMYLSRPGQPFVAGHESAGVTAPAPDWFFAEGATGGFFDLFLLIENPSTQDELVLVEYLLPGGGTLTKGYNVARESRFTIYVDDEQIPEASGQRPLASTVVAMRVRSFNGVPIIAERAMWWPQPAWYEAHNAAGATVTGLEWALAEGFVGGPNAAETYVLIANTSSQMMMPIVVLYFEDGSLATQVVSLPPLSRTNVSVSAMFPSAQGRRFSVAVKGTGLDPALVVERAMYESPGGVTWSAGTAAVATRLFP